MMDEDILEIDFADVTVPVHGVLCPEGAVTRDGRGFDPDSIWWNSLPLPLLWQEKTDMGHDKSCVVGKIAKIERRADGLLWWEGDMLEFEEAQKVVDMIADGALDGLSVDLLEAFSEIRDQNGNVIDDPYMMLDGIEDGDEEAEKMVLTQWVTKGELGGATIVPFPAYRQAFIALGPLEAEVREVEDGEDDEIEALAASAATDLEFIDVAPGKTEDGPGWLTHPIPTDRLRDYWTKGPGAAKIGWGTAGDFRRCRALLAPYVKPQYLSGYCANRHKDALGTWPGKHLTPVEDYGTTAEPFTMVASAAASDLPPWDWFEDPKLVGPSPLTITEDGRVFGHVATWETCHIAFPGKCVTPPHSMTDYSHFCTGAVMTDRGQRRCGVLTVDTGHADLTQNYAQAAAHYDNTGTQVAWVEAGEDAYGIWVAGAITSWATQEQIDKLRSSQLSGDWRPVGRSSEMVAALAVNVGGFPLPRSRETGQGEYALVAAGVVPRGEYMKQSPEEFSTEVQDMISAELDRREQKRAAREAMSGLRKRVLTDRLAKIKDRRTV